MDAVRENPLTGLLIRDLDGLHHAAGRILDGALHRAGAAESLCEGRRSHQGQDQQRDDNAQTPASPRHEHGASFRKSPLQGATLATRTDRGHNKPMNGRLVPTDVRSGGREWRRGRQPAQAAQSRSTCAFSLIMAVKRLRRARFHSLVRNDHSLGETSRSLPSGYSIVRDRRTVTTTLNVGELLNLVGLSTGVVLYAMLLAMVVRAGRTPGLRSGFDPLLLLTSVLGLAWNLCALPVYELPKMGFEGPFPYHGGHRVRRTRLPARGRCALGAAR